MFDLYTNLINCRRRRVCLFILAALLLQIFSNIIHIIALYKVLCRFNAQAIFENLNHLLTYLKSNY